MRFSAEMTLTANEDYALSLQSIEILCPPSPGSGQLDCERIFLIEKRYLNLVEPLSIFSSRTYEKDLGKNLQLNDSTLDNVRRGSMMLKGSESNLWEPQTERAEASNDVKMKMHTDTVSQNVLHKEEGTSSSDNLLRNASVSMIPQSSIMPDFVLQKTLLSVSNENVDTSDREENTQYLYRLTKSKSLLKSDHNENSGKLQPVHTLYSIGSSHQTDHMGKHSFHSLRLETTLNKQAKDTHSSGNKHLGIWEELNSVARSAQWNIRDELDNISSSSDSN